MPQQAPLPSASLAPDTAPEDQTQLAPWAAEAEKTFFYSIAIRVLFFLVIIPAAFALAVWMHFWLIVVTVVVALVVANFFNQVTRLLDRYPKIKALGPLGRAFDLTLALRNFYQEHKPSWFLYYAFYPIAMPIACIFRPVARKEVKLWGKTFALIVSGDILNTAATYSSTYPPYLTLVDALKILGAHLFVALFLSIACLMPVMTTAFTLGLSGRSKSLGWITGLSLLLSVGASGLLLYGTKNQISPTSAQLLAARMKKVAFRKEVDSASEIILTYFVVRLSPQAKAQIPAQLMDETVATRRLREMLNHDAPNDEPKGFYVESLRMTETGGELLFLTVYIDQRRNIYPLFIMGEKAEYASSWKVLPPATQTRLEAAFKAGLPTGKLIPAMAEEFPN